MLVCMNKGVENILYSIVCDRPKLEENNLNDPARYGLLHSSIENGEIPVDPGDPGPGVILVITCTSKELNMRMLISK